MTNLHGSLRGAAGPLGLPASALAIGAHPDDVEFGCGGTVAGWTRGGCHLTLAVVTDGSKGSWDPAIDPRVLASRRAVEQEAAAEALGAAAVVQLGYVDGELEYTMELRRRLAELIRRTQPDVILTHDPWKRYELHPDHRVTGLASVDAMVAARDPLFFPELRLEPHRPGAMLLWSADDPDHWEDVASSLDRKIEALLCHSSQAATTMGDAHRSDDGRELFGRQIRDWAARSGGDAELEYAEAFKRLTP